MTDQTVAMSPEETKRVESALVTAISLYKSGNLDMARNTLVSCLPAVGKVSAKLGCEVMQKIAAIDYDLADKVSLVADLKSYSMYLVSIKMHEKAVTALLTAQAVEPKDPEIPFLQSSIVIGSGDLPMGMPLLRKVVESEPENKKALELFVKSSLKFRPEQVLPYLQKYLNLNSDNPEAYIDCATIYEQLGLVTEAVNTRQKAVEKIIDPIQLKGFLLSSANKYPSEPFFQGRLLELAITQNDVDSIDSHLAQLARIMKSKEDWRSALGFIELRLLVDPRSKPLRDDADQIRKHLGYGKSPMAFDDDIETNLSPIKRKLLFMDWNGFFGELTIKIQNAIEHDDKNQLLQLRKEWLKVENLKQLLADRLDGSHKMPDELWAQLLSNSNGVDELKSIYKKFPTQINVIKSLLEKLGDDRYFVNNVWLDLIVNASQQGDWQMVNACISLLASTNETLAPYIGKLKPVISETLR
jgi:tetratricopeptide (TPR) repeat protein